MTATVTETVKDTKGHAAHTKAADTQEGLRGKIARPIHVTFMGAGSGFCPTLCKDVLLIPGADRGELRLVDVDPERLSTMHKVITQLIKQTGREDGWTVKSTQNRREVLPGTDYVVCCVEVSGTACVAMDNDIPLKYGIDQCIGDTLGPGGLFKGMRTVPVFLDVLRDMRELCPQAIMLNYTNPMSMLVCSAGRAVPEMQLVGLCHSVQGSSHQIAGRLGVPYEQLDWDCAGVNHLAWFTKIQHNGINQYPRLMKQAEIEIYGDVTSSDNANDKDKGNDIVRKDMMLHFGAYITESSGHLSEYLPYYRKSAAGKKYLKDGYEGGSRFYANNWPTWRKNADERRMKLVSGEDTVKLERSWEYGSWIIEAREKDSPFRIHGNVMNSDVRPGKLNAGEAGKLITNLHGDAAVEVSCMIDRNGINPTRYGKLPAQMAHICASQQAYFDLASTACINKSIDAAIHACTLDPLSAAILTPREIKTMVLEMFAAEKEFLPGYK